MRYFILILECNGFTIRTFLDNPNLSPPGRAFLTTTPPRPGLPFAAKPLDSLGCTGELPAREIISYLHAKTSI